MKQLYLLIILLLSLIAYSQPAKDSLLRLDRVSVSKQFILMYHLDKCAKSYYLKDKKERALSELRFTQFYNDSIIGTNPVPEVSISKYLGFKNETDIPVNWKDFISRAYDNTILTLLSLTEKYGYPSKARMNTEAGDRFSYATMFLATYAPKYDKQLKKLFKQEYKAGNISEKEYELFRLVIKRKTTMTKADLDLMKNAQQ